MMLIITTALTDVYWHVRLCAQSNMNRQLLLRLKKRALSFQSWAVATRRPCFTRKWVCPDRGQRLQQSSTTIPQKQEDHSHKATVVHKKNRSKHYLRDATTPLSGWEQTVWDSSPHLPVTQVQVDEACSVLSPVQCVCEFAEHLHVGLGLSREM